MKDTFLIIVALGFHTWLVATTKPQDRPFDRHQLYHYKKRIFLKWGLRIFVPVYLLLSKEN